MTGHDPSYAHPPRARPLAGRAVAVRPTGPAKVRSSRALPLTPGGSVDNARRPGPAARERGAGQDQLVPGVIPPAAVTGPSASTHPPAANAPGDGPAAGQALPRRGGHLIADYGFGSAAGRGPPCPVGVCFPPRVTRCGVPAARAHDRDPQARRATEIGIWIRLKEAIQRD